jgi:hypothetical protein
MSAAFRVEARELKKFKNVILLLEEIKERKEFEVPRKDRDGARCHNLSGCVVKRYIHYPLAWTS